ncbi:MAG: DUF3086 domain-containing protein [Cyanobium sp.]
MTDPTTSPDALPPATTAEEATDTPASGAVEPLQPDGTAGPSGIAPLPSAGEALLALTLQDLLERRGALTQEISALERKREQLQQEMVRSFSGQSDAIARRLRGFQDYLVGALQDLVVAAEQIELVPQPVLVQPSPLDQPDEATVAAQAPPAAAGQFRQDEPLIRDLLQRYGGQPDFQADPWKLRRTLESEGASLLEDWFLFQGGRGAQPSSGSRNRNVLIAAAAISILGELYGDRFQTLVLAGQPERLGEWRRGLQDCLGLSREDFGPTSGIVLFERAEALIERADRLEERGELPFIVIDAAERLVAIPLLQFPLWLAFAAAQGELLLEEDLY